MFLTLLALIALSTPTVMGGTPSTESTTTAEATTEAATTAEVTTEAATTSAPPVEDECLESTFECGPDRYSITTDSENFCFDFGEQFPEGPTSKTCTNMQVTSSGSTDLTHFNDITDYNCDMTVAGGQLVAFTVSSDFLKRKRSVVEASTITFTECETLSFDDGSSDRKRQVPFAAGSSATFGVLASGANGDPHLMGAHGEHYEFYGQPGAVYTLFSTPQFVLNMQLWDKGPQDRYIERLGLLFRNVSHVFSSAAFHPKKFEHKLNRELVPVGGKASLSPFHIELELCEGHSVTINQRVAQAQKDGGDIYHLDVKVTVPGCHDSYGGALGQTYQCRYANGDRFVWSNKLEESFRVKSLTHKAGAFARDAPCHEVARVFAGQSPMHGQSGLEEL